MAGDRRENIAYHPAMERGLYRLGLKCERAAGVNELDAELREIDHALAALRRRKRRVLADYLLARSRGKSSAKRIG